jgi:hypothetical protein
MVTIEQNSLASDGRKKFLFDTEFGIAEEPVAKAPAKDDLIEEEELVAEPEFVEELAPTYSEADLANARREGVQTGRDEAIADMANSLNALNDKVTQLFEVYTKDSEEHSRNAIAVSAVIMRKMFPSLNAEHSLGEIENIITEAMQRTSGAPSLLIKVSTEIFEDIEAKVNEMAALRGRTGKITVMADIDIAPGDLHVEWDGGGILRDTQLMWKQIDEIIERNLGVDISDLAKKGLDQDQTTADESEVLSSQPEQEVVKQALVGENEETVAESPDHEDHTDIAPPEDGAQPNTGELED